MKVYSSKDKCYGCGQCAYVCPVNAITMVCDEEGFSYPSIDEEKCVDCGLCKIECIAEKNERKMIYNKVYACVTKDNQLLHMSSSGGVFGEIAKSVISDGGVVYGAAYRDNKVKHIRITEEKEISLLQGSKYVQSELALALKDIKADIESGRKVLFSGTPCQVAGVRNLVGNNENLLCIDIACMGVPSPKVWEKYVDQYQAENGEVIDVKFRYKACDGESHNITYIGKEGTKTCKHSDDTFMKGFYQGLYLRPSCHACKYKGSNYYGDIRIGDFWGIEKFDKNISQNNGVSVVVLQSSLGESMFKRIQDKFVVGEFTYNQALAYNEHFGISKKPSPNREVFFSDFAKKDNDIKALISEYVDVYPKMEDIEVSRQEILENISELINKKGGIKKYFDDKGINNIAIYGYGKFGSMIVELFMKAGVNVNYIVDKNFDKMPHEIKGVNVIGIHQVSKVQFDAIVVTIDYQYDLIEKILRAHGVDKIMSVSEVK